MKVGNYELIEMTGVWFLVGDDERLAGTLIPEPDGSWRCRTPGGEVRSVRPPDDVPEPAVYVAQRVT